MRSLGTPDGMSDMLVNVIYKDSTGYVWFGTDVALDRFDGNAVRTYAFPEGTSAQRRISAITEGSGGMLYVGSHAGLFRLRLHSDALVPVHPAEINFAVHDLLYDGATAELFAATEHGLFTVDTNTGQCKQTLLRPDVLSRENDVLAMATDGRGGLWLSSGTALWHIDRSNGRTQSWPAPDAAPVCRMVYGDDGVLYIGSEGRGVLRFDTASRRWLDPLEIGNNIITDVQALPDGRLLVSTDGEGVYIHGDSREVCRHLSQAGVAASKLSSNSVYSVLYDDSGVLWVGYYQQGVDYRPHTSGLFDIYSRPGQLDTAPLTVRAVDIDGPRKLIGTREGLYYVDESTGAYAEFHAPQIRSNIIFCVARHGRRYYVGTYGGGMYVFDPEALTLSDFDASRAPFTTGSVFCIAFDADATMWVGTSHGLYRFRDGREIAHYTELNSQLPPGNVYEIFFDSAGRGWICTEHGMAIWNGSELRTDRFPRNFADRTKIRDIYEDSRHRLYFVPDRGEVFTSNLELTDYGNRPYPSTYPGVFTTFVIEDEDSALWFGTDKGLIRSDDSGNFFLFNASDGLLHQVFTLCPPVRDPEGNLWFGNTRGLVKLNYENFRADADRSRPVGVTDIEANGKSVYSRIRRDAAVPMLSLADNENNLTIRVSDFSYVEPQYGNYEYMLDGYDTEWRNTHGNETIHYYDLPPGTYTLRLRQLGHTSGETAMIVKVYSGINALMLALVILLVITTSVAAVVLVRHTRHLREERRRVEESARAAEGGDSAEDADEPKKRYRTTSLTDEECRRLERLLDNIMKTQKPYTDVNLKSADLARLAGTTGHALSYLFNQYMGKSYYDYVNHYRVEEFKRLVAETDTSRYTLSAMAQMCGFSSRASFFRHFKAIAGITPAEYMKNL
ncbi:MAG: helix-turn-helix domain-containing protein [Muribaculaceae bacterium]|nr:helix-turn-helix domain-containing protein [Muribaculaceae bacterium]